MLYLRSKQSLVFLAFAFAAGACSATSSSVANDGGNTGDGAGNTDDSGTTGPDRPDYPNIGDHVYFWGDFEVEDEFRIGRFELYGGPKELLNFAGYSPSRHIDEVAISADGAQLIIAGTNSDTKQQEINVFSIFGGAGTTLFSFPEAGALERVRQFDDVEFSPDGLRVAWIGPFETNAPYTDSTDALYVAPTDGSSPAVRVSQTIADDKNSVTSFVWTDNTHIAFVGDLETENDYSIWGVDVTVPMTTTHLLLAPAGIDARPLAADNAGRVYFRGDFEGSRRLYRAAADGTGFEEVPGTVMMRGGERADLTTFGLSNDGTQLAVAIDAFDDDFEEVFVLPTTGANPTPVQVSNLTTANVGFTQGPSDNSLLKWSPDDSQIGMVADYAYSVADENGNWKLFVMPAAPPTGGIRVLDSPGTLSVVGKNVFSWTPDGKGLYGLAAQSGFKEGSIFGTIDLETANQPAYPWVTSGAEGTIEGIFTPPTPGINGIK